MERDKRNERQFLHDISAPLTVAFGMLDLLREDLNSAAPPTIEAIAQSVAKSYAAVEKAANIIQARRLELHKREEEAKAVVK